MNTLNFLEIKAATLTPKQLLATIDTTINGAKEQKAWMEAVCDWAREIEDEYITFYRNVTARDLVKLNKFLAAKGLNFGTVTVEVKSSLTSFNVANTENWPHNSEVVFYASTSYGTNRINAVYTYHALQSINSLVKLIDNLRAYKERVSEDVKNYNKAVKKLQEAQALIATIKIPYNLGTVKKEMGLVPN